ncbi:MAG TPA: hypothetical protein VGX23_13825 [Actinocrinis sp.]|nr:hypothetical protein [Actinocrinis sp.]
MYRTVGKTGGLGGLAVTGAPNVAVFLVVACALVVAGAWIVRTEMVLRKSGR